MKYIYKILFILCISLLGQHTAAQPPKRKKEEAAKQTATVNIPMTERAKALYPAVTTPDEVVWKRDVYRTLDLNKEKNASLYYPVEPQGENMNLFTFLFKMFVNNEIPAYSYTLDGNESFTDENRITPKELLDNFGIYYEEKDGAIIIAPSDIPSSQVQSYYIKESYYFDQKTATYNQRITAICPVLHRAGDFTTEITKYPMFWLDFDKISPALNRRKIMSSSFNNVSAMTLSDYFIKHNYEGEIYKTVNLRNLSLNQYCENDSAIKKEQKNIETQLADFRNNLWKVPVSAKDSTETAKADSAGTDNNKKEEAKKEEKESVKEKKNDNQKVNKKTSKSSSKKSSSPRVSVRRTRR